MQPVTEHHRPAVPTSDGQEVCTAVPSAGLMARVCLQRPEVADSQLRSHRTPLAGGKDCPHVIAVFMFLRR